MSQTSKRPLLMVQQMFPLGSNSVDEVKDVQLTLQWCPPVHPSTTKKVGIDKNVP